MRAALLLLCLSLIAPSCSKSESSEASALRQELEKERELLRETREELAALTEELKPLTNLASMAGRSLPADYPAPDLAENPAVDSTPRLTEEQQKAMDRGIQKVGKHNYEIDRKLLDMVLANPAAVARGARIVPSIKDGKANGFKLYAIRPSSVYARIGLMNGDTIHHINDLELTTPDRALEVYTRLREARDLKVALTRSGEALTLRYRIR